MFIQPNSLNNVQSMSYSNGLGIRYSPSTNCLSFKAKDSFEKQKFDISHNLEKIKLGKKINEGYVANVYHTNFDGYVVRVRKGENFEPEKLKMLDNPDGIIVAADDDDKMRLMKFVKGEPLYGNGWNVIFPVDKDAYLEYFDKITNLPDKTFSDYLNDIVNIRKSGYDIDNINPNNYLLDGEHINIVDLEKKEVEPKIELVDIYPLINYYHLTNILQDMNRDEVMSFADNLKNFYDRMIEIARKNNYELEVPEIDPLVTQHPDIYLYHKDWERLNIVANTNI